VLGIKDWLFFLLSEVGLLWFAALSVQWEGIDYLKGKARRFLFYNEGVGFQRLLPVK
jgi:hypothetical protein